MLGPLVLTRGADAVALPQSRKVRGLLAYLALAPRPQNRSQLCELLWDTPTDPRGELRWCLSRIRSVIGQRVVTDGDTIALDLAGCTVDAVEVERATRAGIESLDRARQRDLVAAFAGDFLDGLEIGRSPAFGAWLTAQRRRYRAVRAALLERLVDGSDDDEAFRYLDQWLKIAPFDRGVHEALLTRLATRGRVREGEDHLGRAAGMFEAEGLDFAPIEQIWHRARAEDTPPAPARRGSIAVMPFAQVAGGPGGHGGMGDALAHDVTTRLSKLRSMFVIAQGSTTALAERHIGPEDAGRMLNVDYVVGGSVRHAGARLTVAVQLIETHSARIVWSEILTHDFKDALRVLDDIGNRIVASIANEVETLERNRAILRPPNSLDAWESHHRGLWHMYRFTRADNDQARHFFEAALRLDPTFARAHAGLSFTHFQSAFVWGDRDSVDRAFEAAGQSLMADERDPAAHNAMGRALWLRGRTDEAEAELRRTVELSPNFAFGHYSLSFVQAQSGDPAAAIASTDAARALSPFDPLLFAMLGNRAIALARLGRYEEAAESALKAVARPNANPHVFAIAAFTLAMAGRLDEARAHVAALRRARPQYAVGDFLGAFRLEPQGASLFRLGARAAGLT